MSKYRNNNGCITFLWFILVVPMLLFAVGKGCVSCVQELSKSSSRNTSSTIKTNNNRNDHEWGENEVDPVLRTSSGGIFKDPNYPDYYFDITIPCRQCNGKGSWETFKTNPDIYDANGNIKTNVPIGIKEIVKCSACYGTGFEKRPIPPNGKIPLKQYPKTK